MAKSTGRSVSEKKKTAVVLNALAFRRLGAACVAEGATQSEIVERLINERLRDYSVSMPSPESRLNMGENARKRKSSAPGMLEDSASGGRPVDSHAIPAGL